MPRHSFKYPHDIRVKVRDYVRSKVDEVDKSRFQQEPNYVGALFGKLDGFIYEDDTYYIKFTATIYNDRGPNSAEKKSGADFSITASISDKNIKVRKAILFQAKKYKSDLNKKKAKEQISDMKAITRSPKIFVIGDEDEEPYVISGNKILKGEQYSKFKLPEYFTKRILTTFDGDTREEFVNIIQESNLSQLEILVRKK